MAGPQFGDMQRKALHDAFQQTLAPSPLVADESVAAEVRQAASVSFKNFIKFHWVPKDHDDFSGAHPVLISEAEKAAIKDHITDLMIRAPPRVRVQLSEALSIISQHDFPKNWPGLLPKLIERLASTDPQVLNGVLTTADSIFMRYRDQYMSSSLSEELEYSQAVVRPLLAALQAVVALVPSTLSTPPSLILALQNAQMAASTFYSLNSPGLTDAFEETLPGWMAAFHALLVLDAPAAAEPDPEKEGALDGLKATICKCLSLFLERNEEEFAQYLQQFVQAAWTQLVAVSPNPGQDRLALQAINFLAAVARSVHSSLFQDQG
ncbi:Cse1, partial [Helicosporidium sp. ATCC 50920]